MAEPGLHEQDPLWYKDAIIYQLHVKSFFDDKGDGIGDFTGLRRKLDYLESLGATAVWLQPFYPSPQRDDGYDISDYFGIHPNYGTTEDFKAFLDEAHRRGIRVITELVLNHTSDQHEWFQKSRQAGAGSYWRNFYVWSDTKDSYRDARIIFKDFENSNWCWDPVAGAYFWHRFYSHQPDLNFENSNVHKALFKVIDFWLGMGVDGLRLDAVPYLYEKEGTNCENLPETFAFLKKLRARIEERFPGRMLLAEANQWPEDAAAYFGNGDMCHMAFHFPIMPRMFMALQMEDRYPIIDILEQTPVIHESAQWAIFLRNHDELTLEMVSEEERDFMYRSYAQDASARINLGIRRRLAPLVQNSRRRLELLNMLLFSLPGTPVIYYGDEIGMGDNHHLGDRNGVRTPMQWSADRNGGFSRVNPQELFLPLIIDPEYHYQTVNVETEERNLSSLLWWMRRVIAMRRSFRAFSRGSIEFIKSANESVLSFVRKLGDEVILVVINLSRFSQSVALDLSAYAGMTPIDTFSGNRFSRIGSAMYEMTLGFHDYFWLRLKHDSHADLRTDSYELPIFTVRSKWTEIFKGNDRKRLERIILPEYLKQRTTAGCRAVAIRETTIQDCLEIRKNCFMAIALIVKIRYTNMESDLLFLPLTMEPESRANAVMGEDKGLILGYLRSAPAGVVYDCAAHPEFQAALLDAVRRRRTFRGQFGVITGESDERRNGRVLVGASSIRLVKAGTRNTTMTLDDAVFIKLFRRLDEGIHPEIELHRGLSSADDSVTARLLGACAYCSGGKSTYCLATFAENFQHSKTLWHIAVDSVTLHFEEAMALSLSVPATASSPPALQDHFMFAKKARIIGEITARMHKILSREEDPAFRLEPFNGLYQRSLYQSFRNLTHCIFSLIEDKIALFPQAMHPDLKKMLQSEKGIIAAFTAILKTKTTAVRMRIHGDLHLGQIMVMDDRFRICDFEGLPTMPLSERRIKRSPLRDVASMMHSVYCAAHFSLLNSVKIQEKDRQGLLPIAHEWAGSMCREFLVEYFNCLKDEPTPIVFSDESRELLRLYLLERAFNDIRIAIESKPENIPVVTRCLFHYLKERSNILM